MTQAHDADCPCPRCFRRFLLRSIVYVVLLEVAGALAMWRLMMAITPWLYARFG